MQNLRLRANSRAVNFPISVVTFNDQELLMVEVIFVLLHHIAHRIPLPQLCEFIFENVAISKIYHRLVMV